MDKSNLYLIQPLEQKLIRLDALSLPAEYWALDELNDDLSFYKERGSIPANVDPEKWLKGLVQDGTVKPGGWVRLYVPDASLEELWPMAMKRLGEGKTIKTL